MISFYMGKGSFSPMKMIEGEKEEGRERERERETKRERNRQTDREWF